VRFESGITTGGRDPEDRRYTVPQNSPPPSEYPEPAERRFRRCLIRFSRAEARSQRAALGNEKAEGKEGKGKGRGREERNGTGKPEDAR